MPNHVTNILEAKDIMLLPIYKTDGNGDKELDFNMIIPMPEELNITSGCERDLVSCYLTKAQDVGIMKAVKKYYDEDTMARLFPAPHILTQEEIDDIVSKYTATGKTFDDLANDGKVYVDNIIKYGYPDWYSWRCANWGTKWDSYDMQETDTDTIEYLTAWSPAEPIVKKLSEMYPEKRFHLLYSDEFIGQFAGEQVYEGGKLIEDVYAEGLDHEAMPELLYKIFGYLVKECVYIDKDGNVVKKTCDDCQCYDDCDRLTFPRY